MGPRKGAAVSWREGAGGGLGRGDRGVWGSFHFPRSPRQLTGFFLQ